ncbi:MAG: carboxypeptidase regulatory-like domain-containing protein [Planctomycetia bacterium]|nr:MAG: carboxypeptidase regulatory-like domain-containing protein [Planctomycetia bacterium]
MMIRTFRIRSGRFRSTYALIAMLLPALGMSGGQCGGFPFPPTGECPGDPVPSVVLKVTNGAGQVLPTATVSFRVNNVGPFSGVCANGTCNGLVLALDTLGTFTIQVSAPGYLTANQTVTVVAAADGCHPVTQNITIPLQLDNTVAVLAGAWESVNAYGRTIIRFGSNGQVIGAILFDRTIAGDGNFYVAYNNRPIRGAPGQSIVLATANEPTRTLNTVNFVTTTLGYPVGFENAALAADFLSLQGMLAGVPVTYTRLSSIPGPLMDP